MIGAMFENNLPFSLSMSGLVLVESQPVRAWNAGRDMRLAHSFSQALLDSMHFNASLTGQGAKKVNFITFHSGKL